MCRPRGCNLQCFPPICCIMSLVICEACSIHSRRHRRLFRRRPTILLALASFSVLGPKKGQSSFRRSPSDIDDGRLLAVQLSRPGFKMGFPCGSLRGGWARCHGKWCVLFVCCRLVPSPLLVWPGAIFFAFLRGSGGERMSVQVGQFSRAFRPTWSFA